MKHRHIAAVAAAAVAWSDGACWLAAPVIGVALYEWAGPVSYVVNFAVLALMLAYAFRNPTLRSAGVTAQETPAVGTPV